MKTISILFSILFVTYQLYSETVYVVGDVVNVRESASKTGKVIGVLRFGTAVDIKQESSEETLKDIGLNHWYFIESGTSKGWVFGSFLSQSACLSARGQPLVLSQRINLASYGVKFHSLKTEKPFTFEIAALAFTFSNSCEYVATDIGTDVIGGFRVYDTNNGHLYTDEAHDREILPWNQDCIKYHAISETLSGCAIWTEKEFCSGKVRTTGKKGTSPYHSGGRTDPRCLESKQSRK